MQNGDSKPEVSGSSPSTVRSKLRELIEGGLSRDYQAVSCRDGVITGNHYQSICLDGEYTSGFRTPRTQILGQVNFTGLKVLDLGSNLGQISRYVRSRGASVVDGYEFDEHFLDLANLINAHEATTRVSFFQRDIGDKAIYGERYDLVAALSVFIYIAPVIHVLANVADCLLLETHRLDENLQSTYMDPILTHFPVHQVLGESEWLTTENVEVRRAVILFAKTAKELRERLRQQGG